MFFERRCVSGGDFLKKKKKKRSAFIWRVYLAYRVSFRRDLETSLDIE